MNKKEQTTIYIVFTISIFLTLFCFSVFSCTSPPVENPEPEPNPPVVEKKGEVEKPVIKEPEYIEVLKEKVVFYDDFSDTKNGWKIGQDNSIVRSIQKGYYVFGNTHDYHPAFTGIPINLSGNDFFIIESSIKKVGGEGECSYGISWGIDPETNSSYFLILYENYILYGKQENGEWSNIINWKSFPFIKHGNTTNKIAIKKQKENLEIFVNEQPVYETTAYTMFGDNIGFILFGDIMVKVDYLLITSCQKTSEVPDRDSGIDELQITPGHEYLFSNKEQVPAVKRLPAD